MLVVGDFQGKFPYRLKEKIAKEEFDAVIGVGDYAGIEDFRPYVMHIFNQLKKKKPAKSAEEFYGKKRFRNLIKKDNEAAKNILRRLNKIGKPVFLVFGNGDDYWYNYPFDKLPFRIPKSHERFLRRLKNIKAMTYGKKEFKEKWLVGFGGYMDIDAYFDKKHFSGSSDPEKLKKRLLRREKGRKYLFGILKKTKGERIFVLHYPPKGVFDIIRDRRDNPMNGKSSGIGFFREAILKYKPRLVLCGHMHEYQGMKKIGKSLVVNPGDAEKGKYAVVEIPESKRERIKVRFVS